MPHTARWTTKLLRGSPAGWAAVLSAMLGLAVGPARGGSGPYRVVVLVNDNSRESQEIGQYYQEARGIPEAHLVHLATTTDDTISRTAFESQILGPLTNHLVAAGLDGQIDTVVYTRGMPYRVVDGSSYNGVTAATFYGFKTYPAPSAEQCTLPEETANGYYAAEQSFADAAPSGARFLSTMITAWDLAEAKALVDRSAAADGACPDSQVLFLFSTDVARNIRWTQTEDADFARRLFNPLQTGIFIEANSVTGRTDVIGCLVGLADVSGIAENAYLPGALADHLTSSGGLLYSSSQMSILDWISAGASGTYGTVTEPCNYPEKFPHAMVHSWYARGFTLAESYTMSVAHPYMGILVGDPLCAPYAVPPAVRVAGLEGNPPVAGDIAVTVTADAAAPDRPVDRIDLYVDDRFVATLTNVAFAAGDEVSVTVGGRTRSYSVDASEDLTDVAAGLAAALNAARPGLSVEANASGDRVTLTQKSAGEPGAGIPYAAAVTGDEPTLWATAAGPALLETIYPARHEVLATGIPTPGDTLRLAVTRLDEVRVTNSAVAVSGDSALTLMNRLAAAVNTDPDLIGSDGVQLRYVRSTLYYTGETGAYAQVEARDTGFATYNIQIDYAVLPAPDSTLTGPDYAGPLAGNQDVMSARGLVSIARGRSRLSAVAALDTATLADGPHALRAVAVDGTAARVQGDAVVPFVVDNHDLACELLTPGDQEAYLYGQEVVIAAAASGGVGAVTSVQFIVEGRPLAAVSDPPYEAAFSTADIGIGRVTLQALAATDAGEKTLSPPVELLVLNPDDTDGDGLPDGWETLHFTNLLFTAGAADSDGDGHADAAEYVADTDPTDPHHRLHSLEVSADDTRLALRFPTASTRQYAVQHNPDYPAAPDDWRPDPPEWFPGLPGTTTWTGVPASPVGYLRIAARPP